MATRFKQGSLKKLTRKEGKAWVLRVIGINPETAKKVERTPIFVGYVKDFRPSLRQGKRSCEGI